MKKLKKILLPLATAILVIAISIGITLAYLMDEATADNVMTVGNVGIELLEYERIDTETPNADGEAKVQEFTPNKPLLPAVTENGFDYTPGDTYVDWEQNDDEGNVIKPNYTSPIWDPANINNEVDKMVFVRNTGDYSAYVRVFFAFEAGKYTTKTLFDDKIHINLNDKDWKWEWIPFLASDKDGHNYFIAVATYQKVLEPKAVTEISLSQIALDSSASNDEVAEFDKTYNVLVHAQGIQSDGFGNVPEDALIEGFGRDIPFEKLTLVAGIDLKTALHNLNGDGSNPITTKVSNVIFGFNKDHADKVEGYEGTFTSVEQDAEVYTYYVPNATNAANYDIYVLADDTIYTPKISTELFKGMSALTKVDTTNMDVSRTENMSYLFHGCSKLTTLNTSNWNTENVTTMERIFQNCSTLADIDVSEWNVSNVETLRHAFSNCTALTELDTASWRLTNATDMYAMFNSCAKLTTLDVSEWGLNSAINLDFMFYYCEKLNNLNVSKWQVGNVTSMDGTFKGCLELTALDVANWDVRNVTTFQNFLSSKNSQSGDMKMESIDVSKWDTSSATNMKWMFYGCGNIKELDLHNWDVSNVTSMYHMFADCLSLTTLNMKGWNTESLTNMDGIFNTCKSLKVIDVSDFDTHNVTDMDQVFETCYALEEIIGLDKWDTSNVTSMSQMFSSPATYNVSNHLKVLDLSSFDTSKVTNMSEMFQSSPDLVTIYVGKGWDTSNVVDMSNMFRKCSSLTGLDVSKWNTAKVENMEYMFSDCTSWTTLDVSNWNTDKVTSMEFMFKDCVGLTKLDLSNWNTKAVKDSEQMFAGCSNLVTISVGDGWVMSQVEEVAEVKNSDGTIEQEKLSSDNMFLGCVKLEGGAGTAYNEANANNNTYAIVDGAPANPGYLTKKPAQDSANS